MQKCVLIIDDDSEVSKVFKLFLESCDFSVVTAENGPKGLQKAKELKPDLILLDVMMPGMDGYEVCSKLQEQEDLDYIPVVFVTVLGGEQDKAKAFSCGAVDYLVKPPTKELLVNTVKKHLQTTTRWTDIQKEVLQPKKPKLSNQFGQFREFLRDKLNLSPDKFKELSYIRPADIYSFSGSLDIPTTYIAQYIAEFLGLSYIPYLDPETVQLGILPAAFCRKQHIVAISDEFDKKAFVLSNPFDFDLIDFLKKNEQYEFMVTEPENIDLLFKGKSDGSISLFNIISESKEVSVAETKKQPVVDLMNHIIYKAVSQRASDIHIEPKEKETSIRFRVDSDLQPAFFVTEKTGIRLIARFKVISNLDIAEKRKPQDGSFAITMGNRDFKLRVATTSTPHGESLVARLLETKIKPKGLEMLGMTVEQAKIMRDFARQNRRLILLVGPTGSGKTTTIYSLLNQIDCKTRSLLSVEDPVEYTIPDANQQQVNEKIGMTFETLLRSAMRQDPNILFIGELRDTYSASVAIEAASTGHLTITTLHSSDATTAVFRLETLGISRSKMADAILGIVAQKLLKTLCPYCKKVSSISDEERELLSKYTTDIPSQVAQRTGCPKCSYTGYYGREAVYEILKFDPKISEMVRSEVPISQIRTFIRQRGDYLMCDHALEKVRNLKLSVKQVYSEILVEESESEPEKPKVQGPTAITKEEVVAPLILLIEDDEDTQKLVAHLLENQGYIVTVANDGVDALFHLGRAHFDLILSDINMPNLNGLKMLEMKKQKGIDTPVVFLSARTSDEDEMIGLKMGATDYIKKPFNKETLLLRVKRALGISS